MFDIVDVSNKYADGLDMQDSISLYHQILNSHMYNIPYNEVSTAAEWVINDGKVGGIVSAFWTRERLSNIKLDMDRSISNGVVPFSQLNGGITGGPPITSDKLKTVDITEPLLNTFQMY